jgi:hypothetical protein
MPSLTSLAPGFAPKAASFFRFVRRAFPGFRITSARRSRQEQDRLYQSFLAGRNNGLPAVPPGTSDHEKGLAFDMARPSVEPFNDAQLHALGRAWLRRGGRWSPKDPVHFAAPTSPSRLTARGTRRGRRRAPRRR